MMKIGLLLCSLLLFTTGCAMKSFRDLDKRFLVLAVGIDKSEDNHHNVHVSLKLGIPSAKVEPGNAKSQLIETDAESVSEAVRLLKSYVDKEFDFGHMKMIVIGKSLAKEDISETVDFFIRRRDIQGLALMAIGSPDAASVMKVQPKSERLPANALFLSFDVTAVETSYIVPEYLFDFHRRMTEKGLDPYLPIIEPAKDHYIIQRVGVFDKTKMKAELTPSETQDFHELARNFQKFSIPTLTNDVDYTLLGESFDRKFSFDPTDEKTIKLKVSIKGIAEQSKHHIADDEWNKYEQATEEVARDSYLKLLQKLQLNKVDPIGLGLRYRAYHYNGEKDWENWQSIYKDATFDVQVRVKLQGTGVIK